MEPFADFLNRVLPAGWSHDADIYDMDCSLTCPHGEQIEQDGRCSQGCVSPLIGLIL